MAIIPALTDVLFGEADTGKADEYSAKQLKLQEEAAALFENLDVPGKEELLEALKYYEEIPPELAEQLGMSGMEQLSSDPEALAAQKEALAQLSELSEVGMTAEEKFERGKLMRGISGQEQARQKAILQNAAERGVGGSGLELAASLGSSQGAAQRAAEETERLGAMANRRAMEAIGQKGQLGSQMRSQQFGEQSAKARAADEIAKFNLAQRAGTQQRNLARQFQVAGEKVGTTQAGFENILRGKQAEAAATTGVAQTYGDRARSEAEAGQAEHSADVGFMGDMAGAVATYASDINAKENIEDGSSDIKEMLDNLSAKKFDYKQPEIDGEGSQVSVMAQDLEASELGEQFVEDDFDGRGIKGVNYEKMAPTVLAAQAELNEENKQIKGKLAQLEEMMAKLAGGR